MVDLEHLQGLLLILHITTHSIRLLVHILDYLEPGMSHGPIEALLLLLDHLARIRRLYVSILELIILELVILELIIFILMAV